MKHLIRRGLGVALAVVMATGLLSSCGSDYDPVQDIMGYKGSTVLFTVNGQDVTAEQYLFWLAQQADTTYSYASMMQSDDSKTSFWDSKVDENSDKTIADQVKAAAQNYAAMYSVVEAKGKEGLLPGGPGHRQGAAGRRGRLCQVPQEHVHLQQGL